MAQCPKCGIALGCSCSLRSAPDGTQGCSNCIPAYVQQQAIIQQQAQQLLQQVQTQGSQLLVNPQ